MFKSLKNENETFEVLVVDDDKIMTLLHKNQLRRSNLGSPPLLFSNGQEALNYLRKKNDPEKHFLVLLDLNMPVLNGWEFLQLTEEDSMAANIYVVIVTSSIIRDDYIRSKDFKQVIGFFRKPLDKSCMEHLKEIEKLRPFLLQQEDSSSIQKNS